jgi:diacylglycerol kinase (ATP)
VSSANSLAVIINPISGSGGRPEVAHTRAVMAAEFLGSHRLEPRVFITETAGHARELARAQIAQGVSTVVAWGGDGTVNEVASAAAFTGAALAIVPSGSGNGLARELGIPFDPAGALGIALSGGARTMDAGELDGRLFVNIAGLGLDARVAHRFASGGTRRRGLLRYIEITLQELVTFETSDYTVTVDGVPLRSRPLLVAMANGRQYGNGALIAPEARVDDGLIDVVCVEDRPRWQAVLQLPRVFLGQVGQVSGVTMRRGAAIIVTSGAPIVYHVDGEPFVGATSIAGRVRPNALRVRVPQ